MRLTKFMRDRKASVPILLAGSVVPMFLSLGVAVDMGRLSMAKTALQSAVDDAALAGAQAYQTQTAPQAANAQTVATNYVTKMTSTQTALLTQVSVTAVAAPGYLNGVSGTGSNNVQVTASYTMPTTFLSVGGLIKVSVNATATAANPWDQTTSTTTPWQPVVSSGFLSSSAGDWNSVYMYAVPMNGNTPTYNVYPVISPSTFYEVASNCSHATNSQWTASSPCNTWPGAVVPTSQPFPTVTANQPLAFVLFNMTGGVSGGTGSNQYGSASGDMRLAVTAALAYTKTLSTLDDSPAAYVQKMLGLSKPPQEAANTTYASTTGNTDCSLVITLVDPQNPPPTAPATSGSCYALTNSSANLKYANLTCAQIAGRTFIYWWNDMGGGTDDKDYNDMVFSVTCMLPSSSQTSTGGSLYGGTNTGINQTVQLIK